MTHRRVHPWTVVRLEWGESDRHRWMGPMAAVGILSGAALAALGLPPVDLHGPLHYAGVMGPMCGGTRGMHALMLGRLDEAWRYNPAVFFLVLGAVLALIREGLGRLGGWWPNLRVTRRRTPLAIAFLILGALVARQQSRAELLLAGSPQSGLPAGLLLSVLAAPPIAAVIVWQVYVRCRRKYG